MNLLIAELLRFWYRRSMRVAVITLLVFLVVFGAVEFSTHKSQGPDQSLAKQERLQQQQQCLANKASVPQLDCSLDNGNFYIYIPDHRYCPLSLMVRELACDEGVNLSKVTRDQMRGKRTDRADDSYSGPRNVIVGPGITGTIGATTVNPNGTSQTQVQIPHYRQSTPGYGGMLVGMGFVMLMIVAGLAGSFIGGEYRAGTVESVLVVEPRRTRLLLTRFAAGMIGSACIAAIYMGTLMLAMAPTLMFRSNPVVLPHPFWGEVVWSLIRAVGLGALVALLAMAFATIGRSTAAAIMALIVLLIGGQVIGHSVFTGYLPYDMFTNISSVMTTGDVSRQVHDPYGGTMNVFGHTSSTSLFIVLLYAAGFIALAAVSFSRRDVD